MKSLKYVNALKQKMFFLLFVSLLFPISKIYSQLSKVDSLKLKLEKHQAKDTTRVNLLDQLADLYFKKNTQETEKFLNEAETISDSLNYFKGKAGVQYARGRIANNRSNYEVGLNYFKEALMLYESLQDNESIAKVYIAIGITHYNQSKFEIAIENYEKAKRLFEVSKNPQQVVTCLINIGNVNTERGNYAEAISYYENALKQSKLIGNENSIAYINNNLGVVYTWKGNFAKALESYKKVLNYRKKTGDTLGLIAINNNLGDVYISLNKEDKALTYLKKAKVYAEKMEHLYYLSNINYQIGDTYKIRKEYKKALTYFEESLRTARKNNNPKDVTISLISIGQLELLFEKPIQARERFIESQDIALKIGSKRSLSYSLLGIAQSYSAQKRFKKALSYTVESINLAQEINILDIQKEAFALMYEIHKETKNYEQALSNHEKYLVYKDSLFNKEKIEEIAQIEAEYKYKLQLDSASIRELQLNKTIIDTSENLAKTQRNYLWVIIGALLLAIVSGAIIFYQKYKNIKTKNQNIVTEQRLLRSQMTPHFIFNALSVLQGIILNKENKKSITYLSKFSRLLRLTLENSRDKMVVLEQELHAVENYLELQNIETSIPYKYTIEVDHTIDSTGIKIPPMLIQPFIENAIEHGFPNQKENKKIVIDLRFVNKELTCVITDNGIGIDTQKPNRNATKKSLSTTITSERLHILSKDSKTKGAITIEDRKKYNEQGTIVTLVLPYKVVGVSKS